MNNPEIKELHIEASSNCQAKCAMCARTGLNLVVANLKLEWFMENIDPTTLDKIMFCGNLGDPCANVQLLDICRHLKLINPNIVLGINTNGGLRPPSWWTELAETLTGPRDYVVFSIDGTADSNQIYRENVSWCKIAVNTAAFIKAGGSAHWDMLVFQHNAHEVEECIAIAKRDGFSWFRAKESSRWDRYIPGTAGLFPVNDSYLNTYTLPKIDCEANRDSSRYYDSQGHEWPCCHIAEAHVFPDQTDIRKFSNVELLDNYNNRLNTNPYEICQKTCGTTVRTGQWRQEIELKEIYK